MPSGHSVLTHGVVPAVDGEQAAAGDGDGGGDGEVRQRVGGHVRDGRVGGELEHHDDVLLHLVLKHQRTLGKETLLSRTERGGEEAEERRRGDPRGERGEKEKRKKKRDRPRKIREGTGEKKTGRGGREKGGREKGGKKKRKKKKRRRNWKKNKKRSRRPKKKKKKKKKKARKER